MSGRDIMRCFIAIDIDEQVRARLTDLQQQLCCKVELKKGDVKWVRPELMHMTLKFLGEVPDKKIAEVCKITEEVAAKYNAFEFDVESVGFFGGKNARVLWVGTGAGSENLCRLQKDLENQLTLADWPKDNREFSDHLTLCRIKNSKAGIKLAKLSKDYKDYKAGTTEVDSISVYQSQLTPAGPVYTVLANYRLK